MEALHGCQEHFRRDDHLESYACLVRCCGNAKDLSDARKIHALIEGTHYKNNIYIANLLVTAYAQRGHVNEAKCFFDSVEVPNVITWNCMIGAYGQNGHLDDAWALFRRCLQPNIMTWNVLIVSFAQNLHCAESIHLFDVLNLEGFKPDELSFMGLLIACCHLGLVIAARDTLASMVFDYDISPERDHYCCLIGVLAGAGLLDLINTMPFLPDVSNWGCFVSACKIHSVGVDRSVGAACNAIAMDPKNSAPYDNFY
ncbi:pentatricopeptide repeat-containing protein At2g13600-like [Selaginella moellendorffii]|uniref:pentatricopeptide repeat-containing protein At2g13600-like n=1 Tax=Selaginella moellendorffii TaxID=88036 RepID=UPI000D1D01C9|nr:pentatricopeptide repeat-containing protein At2g13600-like [Selaginella moellendorffii]|eukprot:XP_024540709.1 pentatricopeptide repeat-containing protein At2g13600-like [Selaginella moellendorffii]